MSKLSLSSFFVNVAAAGTPVPLLAKTSTARQVTGPASVLITARLNKTTANAGSVYLGGQSTQSEVLEPGDRVVLDVEAGKEIDLSTVFLDAATSGDGAGVTVLQ